MISRKSFCCCEIALLLFLLGGCVHSDQKPLDIHSLSWDQIVAEASPRSDQAASRVRKLSDAQTVKLAERIIENTPSRAEPSTFSWVLLSLETESSPADLQEQVKRRLKQKYTVYSRSEEIPADELEKRGDLIVGYRNGFFLQFRVEQAKNGEVWVHYHDWEAELAASWYWVSYKWTGSDWRVVGVSSRIES